GRFDFAANPSFFEKIFRVIETLIPGNDGDRHPVFRPIPDPFSAEEGNEVINSLLFLMGFLYGVVSTPSEVVVRLMGRREKISKNMDLRKYAEDPLSIFRSEHVLIPVDDQDPRKSSDLVEGVFQNSVHFKT
ncbi:MAG: hypothetical protein VKM97_07805, partial [Cyanobacteriota bacterium]|nr:hypothetical protein [Cyanobacteriota bacterium]